MPATITLLSCTCRLSSHASPGTIRVSSRRSSSMSGFSASLRPHVSRRSSRTTLRCRISASSWASARRLSTRSSRTDRRRFSTIRSCSGRASSVHSRKAAAPANTLLARRRAATLPSASSPIRKRRRASKSRPAISSRCGSSPSGASTASPSTPIIRPSMP